MATRLETLVASLKKQAKLKARGYIAQAIEDSFLPRAERILETVDYRFPDGFSEQYIQALDNGCISLIVSNHGSHFDGLFVCGVSKVLRGIINQQVELRRSQGQPVDQLLRVGRFKLATARSMETGHQGYAIQALQVGLRKRFAQDGVDLVPVTRLKDQQKYDLPLNNPELASVIKRLLKGQDGMALFPEGTLEGGRTANKWWSPREEIKGMQIPEEHFLDRFVQAAHRQGREVVIIPMGVVGGYRIFNPNFGLPTIETVLACYTNWMIDPPVVTVGLPIRSGQIEADVANLPGPKGEYPIEDRIMRGVIAPLLPLQHQGKYSNSQLAA